MNFLSGFNYFNWSSNDELVTLDNQIREDCQTLKSDIRLLKEQINSFDSFVIQNKQLFEACLSYSQQFPEYISLPTKIPSSLDLNDPIDLRTKLLMEKNNLDHMIGERKRFLMRHQKVYQIFVKAMKEKSKAIDY